MQKQKILIVDDEYNVADTISNALSEEGYEVSWQSTGEEALEYIKQNQIDLAILDIGLPGISGLEVLRQIKSLDSNIPAIMLTAADKAEPAIEAMKLGACGYITKPFELERVISSVRKALQEKELHKKVVSTPYKFENIIGESAVMQKLYEKIHQAVNSTADVLLLGETGTGKELTAKAIHSNSNRRAGPFKAVNCSAIPETLIESELFGHEKGAFTGAVQSKQGAMELANGGTLFLDEIGDFKQELQVKLLRVLEERKFTRVGGTKEIAVDIRLICATNKNLQQLVKNGQFREDLYYRINTFPIELPSLRERKEDIPLLIQHFLSEFKQQYGEHSMSPQSIKILMSYNWPGNIRELKNLVERILTSFKGAKVYTIYSDHIPDEIKITEPVSVSANPLFYDDISLKDILRQTEKAVIEHAIEKSNRNLSKVASLLKVSYPTLIYRINRLGIKCPTK